MKKENTEVENIIKKEQSGIALSQSEVSRKNNYKSYIASKSKQIQNLNQQYQRHCEDFNKHVTRAKTAAAVSFIGVGTETVLLAPVAAPYVTAELSGFSNPIMVPVVKKGLY